MKKNWMLMMSLALNVVLLAGLVLLGGKVENFHAETMSRLNQIGNDVDVIQERVGAIRETQREQTEFVEDHSFDVTGVDAETGALNAQMELTLRRWAADTTVDLLATVDGESRTFPMTGVDGVFTAPVSLPLDGDGELRFEAVVTAQGVTSREDVTGYETLSMLRPLRYAGDGYGGPEYQDGVLEVYAYSVDLERQYGADVVSPVFRVVKNGVTVREVPAVFSGTTEYSDPDMVDYAPDTEDESLRVECAMGDTVEIRLVCRDSFGLDYEFPLNEWEIDQELLERAHGSATASGYSVRNDQPSEEVRKD